MTAESGIIANRPLTFRPRGWDLINPDGTVLGMVFQMNDGPMHLCHLTATESEACVSGKGDTREAAVARALQVRAAFADAIGALIKGTHGEDSGA
jgi:hypothetical protein